MYFYFLTIDKCSTFSKPDELDYVILMKLFMEKDGFSLGKYPIESYEFKHKSVIYPRWIHYHCVFMSEKYLNFKDYKCKGYSIKLKLIKNMFDLYLVCGYTVKRKKDKINF